MRPLLKIESVQNLMKPYSLDLSFTKETRSAVKINMQVFGPNLLKIISAMHVNWRSLIEILSS